MNKIIIKTILFFKNCNFNNNMNNYQFSNTNNYDKGNNEFNQNKEYPMMVSTFIYNIYYFRIII